ncbi:FeoA family protein [Streptomyces toyocaensis]|uniref:FeoA family protein n=1 Tax=Streptomyces toyocaensis TaxID=55952 RepID=UPI00190F88BC|nr:FeoA family protein [Streptomyces toyocaensis]
MPDERRGTVVSGVSVRALADLAPGSRATVVEVVPDAAPGTARRLGALGFTPGTVVEVVRRAPLRDPAVYRVRDYEVCLRRAQAACVRTTGVER